MLSTRLDCSIFLGLVLEDQLALEEERAAATTGSPLLRPA